MSEALNPSFVKRRSYLVALIRRSSLVSRRSQALIFLLSRYASRFTNDGLLEIRFTIHASLRSRTPLTVFWGSLLLRKGELGQLSLVETLLHQRAHIEHSFDLLNVIESGFRAGVRRGKE